MSSRPRRSAATKANEVISVHARWADSSERSERSERSMSSRRSGRASGVSVSRDDASSPGGDRHLSLTVKLPSNKLRQATRGERGFEGGEIVSGKRNRGAKKSYVVDSSPDEDEEEEEEAEIEVEDDDDDEMDVDAEGEEDAEGDIDMDLAPPTITYMKLSDEVQAKKVFTAEELSMRRQEMARRRRNLSEKRNEEVKMETINKLLKKQAPKINRKAAAAGAGGLEDSNKPDPVFVRWVSNKTGVRVAVTEEMLDSPAGQVFKPASKLAPGKMVQEVA
ncbi:hypothetical protein FPRO04_07693 [Fusarium proliferatum]|nr:hypothetical protein FPRO04_07693 [Fusarium proliferatum]